MTAKQKTPKDKSSTSITDAPEAFRKWFKTLNANELRAHKKPDLQRIYDRALIAYPDSGGAPISRKERALLYALQEALFGALDNDLKVSLENIGKTLATAPNKRKQAIDYQLPQIGTVIVKHWKGTRLEVTITKDGFEYEGQHYKSLSQLAKHIAGYGMSGPIFFGLRKPKMKCA